MKTTNDHELKLALAKLLPDQIEHAATFSDHVLSWKYPAVMDVERIGQTVTSREWLHVCWLAEKALLWNQVEAYRDALSQLSESDTDIPIESCVEHWSWQQRAWALVKVKGMA